jgi:PhzF family phenazine biosynthesis protein
MPIPLYQVDAFTNRPFAGNPAAVCFLDAPREDGWMQSVALEMNLSETAFLQPHPDGFGLRWFTPAVEVDLCGHATLAAAHTLWETGRLAPDRAARFFTRSGWLVCRRAGDWIEMDFPAKPERRVESPPGLLAALGVTSAQVLHVGRNQFDYLVQVESAGIVRGLKPNHGELRKLSVRGVTVTAASDRPEFDFVSRFFAPGSGIDEDPVTGSAHCALGPFWQARLRKDNLMAYQASARGGVLRVRPRGERVLLAGQAVTVLRGELG